MEESFFNSKILYSIINHFDYEKFNEMKLILRFLSARIMSFFHYPKVKIFSVFNGPEFSWEDEKEDDLISELLN